MQLGRLSQPEHAPLDGAEDPTVAGELGISRPKPFSAGSIGWHQAVVSFIARDLGGCLGLRLMQTVPPQCSAACKGVYGSAIASPEPYHKIIDERDFLRTPAPPLNPQSGAWLCFFNHSFECAWRVLNVGHTAGSAVVGEVPCCRTGFSPSAVSIKAAHRAPG